MQQYLPLQILSYIPPDFRTILTYFSCIYRTDSIDVTMLNIINCHKTVIGLVKKTSGLTFYFLMLLKLS